MRIAFNAILGTKQTTSHRAGRRGRHPLPRAPRDPTGRQEGEPPTFDAFPTQTPPPTARPMGTEEPTMEGGAVVPLQVRVSDSLRHEVPGFRRRRRRGGRARLLGRQAPRLERGRDGEQVGATRGGGAPPPRRSGRRRGSSRHRRPFRRASR